MWYWAPIHYKVHSIIIIKKCREEKLINYFIFPIGKGFLCMLRLKLLLEIFWVEAISCAIYSLNRWDAKSVYGKTLQGA